MPQPMPPNVAAIFDGYPGTVGGRLRALRQLVLDVAQETDGVGPVEETLKWAQPSFLTPQTKSGSTIRIDGMKSDPGKYAMYFICHTNLVETFEQMYGDAFTYEGNRALIFDVDEEVPEDALRHCVALALTYHLVKRNH